ncbi:hypothetical protein CAL22_16045 [Bordetella genomosp. 12]|uniref:Uncharacterized protein n=1 Tax=Bordetella genomosp. 12 TaxID=463035 RepID=A0A261VB19_9BORD|nr:hypothetical protein CAL22_16045 [Bordetella genomosp. 12]
MIEAHADQIGDPLIIMRVGRLAIQFVHIQAVILVHTLLKIGTIFAWERGAKPYLRRRPWVVARGFRNAVIPCVTHQFISIKGNAVQFDVSGMGFACREVFMRPVFGMDRDDEGILRWVGIRGFQSQAGIEVLILDSL